MNKMFLLALAVVACLAVACKKTNEDLPLQRLLDDDVFDPKDSIGYYARAYQMNIYAAMPNNFSGVNNSSLLLDAGSDDAIASTPNSVVEQFVNGRWSAWNLPDNVWGRYYSGIRMVNVYLSRIGVVPIDPVLKSQYKAECRFLRALFYFELVKRWGGVALVGDKVFSLDDNLQLSRNSYDDCVHYIMAECDSIKGQLKKETDFTDGDWGRIPRGAAYALKAKTMLYAASPWHAAESSVKWQDAAAAAADLVSLGYYTLEPSFATVFSARKSREIILAYQAANNTTLETNYGPTGFSGTGVASGMINPTQNLVNAFGMKNGKAITDAGSGYDPGNPYANRDPRLALTVMANGTPWLGRTVQTYTGGLDYSGTRTGYFMRKFLGNFATGSAYTAMTHNPIIFRYAEILLDYAEALNEASAAPPEAAFAAVEQIRQRAGLSPYTLSRSLNQSQLRMIIRNERRTELAFEEQRFWDIRRWKIADQLLNNQPLTGVSITQNANGSFAYDFNRPVLNTVFDAAKMYLYPVPQTEIDKNRNLKQNPNW